MDVRPPAIVEVPADPAELDALLGTLPDSPAVFLVLAREGAPYLARTSLLRRRLLRLLRERRGVSRLLNLRAVAARIEYWLTASPLESGLLQYELAKRHFPETWAELIKLRMPPYVRVLLENEFPRTLVTSRLGASRSLHYGPFRTRAAAELFESRFLDLFQIRRCQEDLAPSPQHPGCIYGEMQMCLRPCQEVVSSQEYASEVERVVGFLGSHGRVLLDAIEGSRDRLSEEMNFEEAARQHKRLEKVQQVLRLRDELVADIDRLHGIAVAASAEPDAVELWPVVAGVWQGAQRLTFEVEEGKPVSLDRKLREILGALRPGKVARTARQEHLALLARWYYSSWRTGEWVGFDSFESVPYRRLVNAIHRTARPQAR